MVWPVPSTFSCGVGESIFAGHFPAANGFNALIDEVAALPGSSWLQINSNSFSDAWPDDDLRSPYQSAQAPSQPVLDAWSSIGYDAAGHRFVLWGGGHANTADNSVYLFDLVLGEWSLAFAPSDYYSIASNEHTPVCGGFRQPCSSHTYCNQLYLPILNRFITFGGANHGLGKQFRLYDGNTELRLAPCYTLDLELAGQGYVAGGTGDNVHFGAYAGVDLPGANAWTVRDWLSTSQGDVLPPLNLIDGLASYREENGRDVVYVTISNSTAKSLFRIEFVDQDPANDVITQVGRYWNSFGGEIVGGIDPVRNIFAFKTLDTTYPLGFWDLKTAGPSNNNQRVPFSEIAGSGKDAFMADAHYQDMGMDYCPTLDKYVCWARGGTIYTITAPDGDPTSVNGWVIEQLISAAGPRPLTELELGGKSDDAPPGYSDRAILGKWTWAADLGCFLGVQHIRDGNVWVWKPPVWVDPREEAA